MVDSYFDLNKNSLLEVIEIENREHFESDYSPGFLNHKFFQPSDKIDSEEIELFGPKLIAVNQEFSNTTCPVDSSLKKEIKMKVKGCKTNPRLKFTFEKAH